MLEEDDVFEAIFAAMFRVICLAEGNLGIYFGSGLTNHKHMLISQDMLI